MNDLSRLTLGMKNSMDDWRGRIHRRVDKNMVDLLWW